MGVQVKVQEELLEEEQEVVLVREEERGGEAEAKIKEMVENGLKGAKKGLNLKRMIIL